ncbi:pilus assembly protein [Pseudomonas sp. PDM15]|uniref:TadE/TadG family type IV pilus assembly protein n=1 Tax=Pseudomonas sp. PDM15 TaxID=2769303 RepID=UPI001785E7BE|nr:TadE/TadG family type IV pilus assembly protein [Pseudomonas sp. PDM15]MBD9425744.1 pilus assembly protein [Pseudomonas sp. PDM15]
MASINERNGQRGVAMVEFAIALPLLLLLLFGIAEFGRMLFQYNSLLQAGRDAGRYAASEAWNATLGKVELSGELQARVKNVAVYGVPSAQTGSAVTVPGLTTDQVQVSALGAEHVVVSISYTFQPVIGTVLPSFTGDSVPLNVLLTSSVVMRAL